MGAIISYAHGTVCTTNTEWEYAVQDAIDTAEARKLTPEQAGFVADLVRRKSGFFSGYCPDFSDLFPDPEARLFWAAIWEEAANKLTDMRDGYDQPSGRRVFINYWCSQCVRWASARDIASHELWHELPPPSDLNEISDSPDEALRLELLHQMREADRRGRMSASKSSSGWTRCPWCREAFSLSDKGVWDGDRHLPCFTRISVT